MIHMQQNMLLCFIFFFILEDKTDNRMLRPVYQTVFGGFRSANSVSEFLRLIGIRGKNVRLIRQLEVLNLALTLCNGEFNGK